MRYIYLLINLALLVISLVPLFNKTRLISMKGVVLPAVLISGVVFSALSFALVQLGAWSFNSDYLLGIYLGPLPVEELLYYFILSFACLNIYGYLNERFPKNDLEKFSLSVSNLLLGVCIAMLFFTYTKWYSVTAFSILFLLLFYVEYINKLRFMYRFYRTYAVSFLLFFVSYSIITGLPALSYLEARTMKLKLGTVPFETCFYFMGMFLLNIYLYEFFRNRAKS